MPSYKGKFQPKNPKKYMGDPENIIFRSSWELRAFKFMDERPEVLEWRSEEVIVPYFDPSTGRHRRYFPDIVARIQNPDGTTKTVMMEIKPMKETKEPKVQKKRTKKYVTEVTTWATNQAKWKSAQEYCKDRGWQFVLVTEYQLGIKK
jgi:hypothetical protein